MGYIYIYIKSIRDPRLVGLLETTVQTHLELKSGWYFLAQDQFNQEKRVQTQHIFGLGRAQIFQISPISLDFLISFLELTLFLSPQTLLTSYSIKYIYNFFYFN